MIYNRKGKKYSDFNTDEKKSSIIRLEKSLGIHY